MASLTRVHWELLTLPLTFKVMRMFPGYDLLVVLFAHDGSRLVNGLNGCSRPRLLLVAATPANALSSVPAGKLSAVLIALSCSNVRCEQEVYKDYVTRAAAVTAAAAVRRSPARDTQYVYNHHKLNVSRM